MKSFILSIVFSLSVITSSFAGQGAILLGPNQNTVSKIGIEANGLFTLIFSGNMIQDCTSAIEGLKLVGNDGIDYSKQIRFSLKGMIEPNPSRGTLGQIQFMITTPYQSNFENGQYEAKPLIPATGYVLKWIKNQNTVFTAPYCGFYLLDSCGPPPPCPVPPQNATLIPRWDDKGCWVCPGFQNSPEGL